MSYLVDTNVLLRMAQPDHPSYEVSVDSVSRLLAARESLHITSQNIAEFWNVATRPAANNGMALSAKFVLARIEDMEETLDLLPEIPSIYHEWKHLVTEHDVVGAKVHDAKLVATMHVYGVQRILTFNTADFKRYDIAAVNPAEVCA